MIVAIDAGNSAVKVARVERDRVELVANVPTADIARAAPVLREAAAGSTAMALVSVVPSWTSAVRHVAVELGSRLLMADHGTIPIPVNVPHPERVGADRLLDAWAATVRYGVPLIVVDLGTATTVDAVGPDGVFLGGAILPGIELGARALERGTAQLPEVTVTSLPPAIGTDTTSAITSGLVLGHLGAVRELVARMQSRIGSRAMVVVTGGLSRAPWATSWTRAEEALPPIADAIDPDLTLRGLGALASRLAPAA